MKKRRLSNFVRKTRWRLGRFIMPKTYPGQIVGYACDQGDGSARIYMPENVTIVKIK